MSFTGPSDKMLDQNEMKYFVYFKDLFSFCIFAIKCTPLIGIKVQMKQTNKKGLFVCHCLNATNIFSVLHDIKS